MRLEVTIDSYGQSGARTTSLIDALDAFKGRREGSVIYVREFGMMNHKEDVDGRRR